MARNTVGGVVLLCGSVRGLPSPVTHRPQGRTVPVLSACSPCVSWADAMLRTPVQCLLEGLSSPTVAPGPEAVGVTTRDMEVALDTWLQTSSTVLAGGGDLAMLAMASLAVWWPRWHPQGLAGLAAHVCRDDRPQPVRQAWERARLAA